jgi:SAM-dependent methyltransferase
MPDIPIPTAPELDAWYREGHYGYLDSPQAMSLYKTVANAILRFGCRRILDVGCYHAHPLRYLPPGSIDAYVGFDLCAPALERNRNAYVGRAEASFVHSDWDKFPDNNTSERYDCIYIGGVFYYIFDRLGFLRRYLAAHSPRLIVVQDLFATDLAALTMAGRLRERHWFDMDFFVDESEWDPGWNHATIRERQIVVLETGRAPSP